MSPLVLIIISGVFGFGGLAVSFRRQEVGGYIGIAGCLLICAIMVSEKIAH